MGLEPLVSSSAAFRALIRSSAAWVFSLACALMVTGAANCLDEITGLIPSGFEQLYCGSMDKASARRFFPLGDITA